MGRPLGSKDLKPRKRNYRKLSDEVIDVIMSSPMSGRYLSKKLGINAAHLNKIRKDRGYQPPDTSLNHPVFTRPFISPEDRAANRFLYGPLPTTI